ncbi:MbnP family protein [Pontibacter burrus]|uniref:Copper-binding protein MbnP-like domain-containing protein n=1 Tax=Pontibacter burrus TaxID=2704466 RepID=A0A6B3LWH9_9BACT|nr:MbnP family protein [Pontibacter burrus]NEM98666.1 hypothetical protein [Pontibacter burrus]
MTRFYKITLYIVAAAYSLLLSGCSSESDEPLMTDVEISITNEVNGQPLVLLDKTYTNPSGDTYVVHDLKYFMSNVKLINSRGEATYIEPDSYHLIDEQIGKRAFTLKNVKADTYTKLEFGLGVDAARNHSTDQYGDLDPSSTMVWDWDTGYKFLSLVGTYVANTKEGGLVFHIGGDTNYKTITVDLQQPLKIQSSSGNRIQIVTDLNGLFLEPNPIDFDEINTAMTGPAAAKIAENYSTGFFKQVTAN